MKLITKKSLMKAGWFLFYLYIILLSYFLFFSERYGRENTFQEYRYNLILFKEIKRFILYRQQLGYETFIVNIVGNVIAFAPFGFLLPLLEKRYRKIIYTTFLCLLFSLCVELVQMYLRVGIFDVDDIMMNTVGAILGYLCYLVLERFQRKMQRKRKKR